MQGVAVFLVFAVALVAGQGIDPRRHSQSQCQSTNNRNCTESQLCVEKKLRNVTLHACVNRTLRNEMCMPPQDFRMSDRREPARLTVDGVTDRDVSSIIDGRMAISCEGSLQCRNRTCQQPRNTTCTRRRRIDSRVRCNEDGMFELTQCRRLPNETNPNIRPSALQCSCANRMTGQMRNSRIVRTRAEVPNCGRSCTRMQNGRNFSVRHGQMFTLNHQDRSCSACQCNNGDFTECKMLTDTTCFAGQGNMNCRSNDKDVPNGELKTDGRCNRCRCTNGTLRCTQLPGCQRNSTNQETDMDNEKDRMQCEACMDMVASPVCVPHQGRTFPTRCHAMMCAKVSRNQIVDGPCRDDNACKRNQCTMGNTCFRTGSKTQMSNRMDRPDARRTCVSGDSLNCATTRNSTDSSRQRLTEFQDSDKDLTDYLRGSKENSNDRDQNRVVCGTSNRTFPSTCHMILESDQENPEVRHKGACRDIMPSEMVCGTDGVTYRSMGIMQTQGGNVRMDYSGACRNVTSGANTIRNRCEMVRMKEICPKLTNCTRRVNTTDGCCPICGGVAMLAMDQSRVENQANTFPDLDTFMGALLSNHSDGKLPLIPRNATDMCRVSITRPTNVPGNVSEVVFQARNMSHGKECHMHAMEMVDKFNKAGGKDNMEPITTAESMVAAAAVAPELEDPITDGSIAFAASPVLLLCLLLCKAFFV